MDYKVESVSCAIGLLLFVARYPGLGVSEIARRSGNSKARTFRLLSTLEESGMVQRDAGVTYRLGFKTLYLGAIAKEQIDIARLAQPVLSTIIEKCDENVHIRIRDGVESLMVAQETSKQRVRIHEELGTRRPLHVGASGKLLLAFAPANIQEAVLSERLEKFTNNTLVTRSALEAELAKINKLAYSISFSERAADVVAFAAPVRDSSGEVVAALGIAVPYSRFNENKLDFFIDCAKTGAEEFSKLMGFLPY
ncbi:MULTISPECIES: IclR family transcriptional regulator [unclassified Undibacterium]|uniref:IclR family transcriptional regulator n=1 Tax=unclassified Undibacterium TaxID=2630295 RepID=UPI002AC8FA0E|nr:MULTISPECIES: IclR family transcriptional regulator [unclassified Undibacterium]MEB0138301.1 IclR family transcriptional regulator [Undibacterium sp. CCC2.1]MEB0170787.1 IclR family transcriptional regulator [Undibacterium sp. CCC1.1]MEB0174676.1 IclR family transcriptional regulator [Undibacterium sp. CCC3.4]MEB0213873.1 IclR family transcriptional regulator [Undibacterium sp. 5I2]WPX42599.1 IclR family transcriptional regulator [Undibacterium sp. CCC3.4]